MRVAIIFDDLELGGWSSLVASVKKMRERGVEPFVVSLFDEGDYGDEFNALGIPVYCLRIKRMTLLFKFIRLVWFLRTRHIDVVHVNLRLSRIIGLSAAWISGVSRRIVHVHSLESRTRSFRTIFERFFVRKASLVIAVSQAAAETFEKTFVFPAERIKVIPNGIDVSVVEQSNCNVTALKNELGIPADGFVILTIAHLKWQKGHASLVQAARIAEDQDRNGKCDYIFVGDGPEREKLAKLIEATDISDHFHLMGKQRNIADFLALADLFVLPSKSEGFGTCVLEAFAAGVPVVATNVGGIPEIATDGENALLVPPDSPEILAQAILSLKRDPQLRSRFIANARGKVADYDVERIVDKLVACY